MCYLFFLKTRLTNRHFSSFNKYSQIAARALRQSLKETERVAAEKRGSTILRYQEWKDGQGGQQVRFFVLDV